jgi:tetratricopeptide (TPR) repeat protein
MPLIYRVMTRDGDKPMIGDTANKLGVRPGIDLPVNGDWVAPNTGGMSVSPSLRALPYFLIPKRLKHVVRNARGKNTDACWRLGQGSFESGDLADGLALRVEHKKHALVEPANDTTIAAFQDAIAATCDQWVIDEQSTMVAASQSPPAEFLRSLELLKRLHLLSMADNDQAEEADQIRDAMERLWWRLTDLERQRLEGLSGDLYSIGESQRTLSRVPATALREFEAATIAQDWDKALTVLREHEQSLPTADVAAMRAVAWGSIGYHDIAVLFFAEAVRLSPDDTRLKCLYLRALVRGGERERAKQEATRIANTADNSLDLLLAADVLFDCEQPETAMPSAEVLRQVADLCDRALKTWNRPRLDDALVRLAYAGFLSGAISFELIGDQSRADKLYAMAQSLLPGTAASLANASPRKSTDRIAMMIGTKNQVGAEMLASPLCLS